MFDVIIFKCYGNIIESYDKTNMEIGFAHVCWYILFSTIWRHQVPIKSSNSSIVSMMSIALIGHGPPLYTQGWMNQSLSTIDACIIYYSITFAIFVNDNSANNAVCYGMHMLCVCVMSRRELNKYFRMSHHCYWLLAHFGLMCEYVCVHVCLMYLHWKLLNIQHIRCVVK